MKRGRSWVLLVVVAVLALGACRVDSTVSVDLHEDGSGTIRVRVALDADAVAAIESGGEPLEASVRLADLRDAGWGISPWDRRPRGEAILEIDREFDSPASFERLMADLNGTDGPLRDVRLERSTDVIRKVYEFAAVADVAGVIAGVTDDEELVANLTAQRVDVDALEVLLTAQVREALHLRVEVSLPDKATRTWDIAADTRQTLLVSSTTLDVGRIALLVVGVVVVGAAIGVLIVTERRARRR